MRKMKLWNGRIANFVLVHKMGRYQWWAAPLTKKEVKSIGLAYSSKYAYSINTSGVIERWQLGNVVPIAQHFLPEPLNVV